MDSVIETKSYIKIENTFYLYGSKTFFKNTLIVEWFVTSLPKIGSLTFLFIFITVIKHKRTPRNTTSHTPSFNTYTQGDTTTVCVCVFCRSSYPVLNLTTQGLTRNSTCPFMFWKVNTPFVSLYTSVTCLKMII